MRAPPRTPEQQREDQRLYALANGSPELPEADVVPRNRRQLRALVTLLLRRGFTFRDPPPRFFEPPHRTTRGLR